MMNPIIHRRALLAVLAAATVAAPVATYCLAAAADDEVTITLVGDVGLNRSNQPVEADGVRRGEFQTWAETTSRIEDQVVEKDRGERIGEVRRLEAEEKLRVNEVRDGELADLLEGQTVALALKSGTVEEAIPSGTVLTAEALRDMRLHEIATVAAMRSAVRALFARFEPVKLRAAAEHGGLNVVPMQTKARAWDAFEEAYAQISQALVDDFDGAFGKDFARAYERALSEAAAKEPMS